MNADEVDVLRESIARHGVEHPLDILDDGTILDGHHRYSAARLEGLAEVPVRIVSPADPVDYMVRAALERRHLSGTQKRELAGRLLKAEPEQSDRRVAKTVGVAPTTVGKVRKQLEEKGDVSRMDTREDSKGRQQPATKVDAALRTARPPRPEVANGIGKSDATLEELKKGFEDVQRMAMRLVKEQPEKRWGVAQVFRKMARSYSQAANVIDPPKRKRGAGEMAITIDGLDG